MRRISKAIGAMVLVGVLPTMTLAAWSDWEALDRRRGIWIRVKTFPSGQSSHMRYQFRNDSVEVVTLECMLRSYDRDGRPIDTVVREQLGPGVSDTHGRFVIGDGTLNVECAGE